MKKSFLLIFVLTEIIALSPNRFISALEKEPDTYLSAEGGQNEITSEVDTLYYLPDTAAFYDNYLIASEIYNIHTNFYSPVNWNFYKVKEVQLLFSSMVIGDTLKKIEFFKDTLKNLVYSYNINAILNSTDVYPNWYKVIIPNDFPSISGEIEVPSYLIDVATLCIPQLNYISGNTIGFFEGSQKWEAVLDSPIKLIIERDFTDVKEDKITEMDYKLYQNYPNPFNPSTTISYALPQTSDVEIIIYDIMGREVKQFIIPTQNAGYQNVVWDGRNNFGISVSSGIYIFRFRANSLEDKNRTFEKSAKLMLIK